MDAQYPAVMYEYALDHITNHTIYDRRVLHSFVDVLRAMKYLSYHLLYEVTHVSYVLQSA